MKAYKIWWGYYLLLATILLWLLGIGLALVVFNL